MAMMLLLSVATSIIAGLITIELVARSSRLSRSILRSAVKGLPRKYRKRFEEEWASDLAAQPTELSQLIFSIGLQIAATRISVRERQRVLRARGYSAFVVLLQAFRLMAPLTVSLQHGRLKIALHPAGALGAIIGVGSSAGGFAIISLAVASGLPTKIGHFFGG